MSTIVNNNDLVYIITNYGLDRIAEALRDPSVTIELLKMKVGTGYNEEYYVPTEDQAALKGPIPGGEFYVIKKELLEDGQTVSFNCIIPETFSGFDIREVGLYETVNDEDKLFAIVVQQPIVKPKSDYGYYMSIDYYMFLKASNLADIYDRIILNPNNQLITEDDISALLNTILFTQGNLSVQIGQNSEAIGYNRATELYDFAVVNRNSFGYLAACSSYTSFANYVGRDNVFGYWVFDYPKRNEDYKVIRDISPNGYNMSTSQNVALFDQNYEGIMSTLSFNSPSYFYLDSSIPLSFLNEAGTADLPFTMFFVVNPLSREDDITLLARSNYSMNAVAFEIKELFPSASIQIKLFTNSSNYMTFTTPANSIPLGCHCIMVSYNNTDKTITVYINGENVSVTKVTTGTYTHMFSSVTTLYGYSCTPHYIKYTHTVDPTASQDEHLFNADGSPYEGSEWTIDQNQVYYNHEIANYSNGDNILTSTLYSWVYDDGIEEHIIYTKSLVISEDTTLYNADYTEYTGLDFSIDFVGGSYKVLYLTYVTHNDGAKDIEPVTLYAWKYEDAIQKIWANSSSNPTIMFNQDGSIHSNDSTWNLSSGVITYVPSGETATYNSSYNTFVSKLDTTSYIVNSSGIKTDSINSSVGMIGIAFDNMSGEDMRVFSMELGAQIGLNPCISPS